MTEPSNRDSHGVVTLDAFPLDKKNALTNSMYSAMSERLERRGERIGVRSGALSGRRTATRTERPRRFQRPTNARTQVREPCVLFIAICGKAPVRSWPPCKVTQSASAPEFAPLSTVLSCHTAS